MKYLHLSAAVLVLLISTGELVTLIINWMVFFVMKIEFSLSYNYLTYSENMIQTIKWKMSRYTKSFEISDVLNRWSTDSNEETFENEKLFEDLE